MSQFADIVPESGKAKEQMNTDASVRTTADWAQKDQPGSAVEERAL
jgi:hypothetical protein